MRRRVRFKAETYKKIDNYMKAHKLKEFSDGVNKYMEYKDRQLDEARKENKCLRSQRDRLRKKAEKLEEKLARVKAKRAEKNHQKQKMDSTSKPQRKKRWRTVLGFQYNLWYQRSDGGHGCPFQEGLVFQKHCQNCKKSTPDRFQQCIELHNQYAQKILR